MPIILHSKTSHVSKFHQFKLGENMYYYRVVVQVPFCSVVYRVIQIFDKYSTTFTPRDVAYRIPILFYGNYYDESCALQLTLTAIDVTISRHEHCVNLFRQDVMMLLIKMNPK